MSRLAGKRTLVLGASLNPERYSHAAVEMLGSHGHEVLAIGLRQGTIGDVEVNKGTPDLDGIHTVTLYMNPGNQQAYYEYILGLHPQRIIFNPGTENVELRKLAELAGVEVVYGCTLYMLSLNLY